MPPPKQKPTAPSGRPFARVPSSARLLRRSATRSSELIAPSAAVASGVPAVPPARASRSGASAL